MYHFNGNRTKTQRCLDYRYITVVLQRGEGCLITQKYERFNGIGMSSERFVISASRRRMS